MIVCGQQNSGDSSDGTCNTKSCDTQISHSQNLSHNWHQGSNGKKVKNSSSALYSCPFFVEHIWISKLEFLSGILDIYATGSIVCKTVKAKKADHDYHHMSYSSWSSLESYSKAFFDMIQTGIITKILVYLNNLQGNMKQSLFLKQVP